MYLIVSFLILAVFRTFIYIWRTCPNSERHTEGAFSLQSSELVATSQTKAWWGAVNVLQDIKFRIEIYKAQFKLFKESNYYIAEWKLFER